MKEKLKKLELILSQYGTMALGLSGGVDSTFLLLFAKKVLGSRLIAVTAQAPNFAPDEVAYAQALCKEEGITHVTIDLGDEILSHFSHNPPDRCYLCKKAIFSSLKDRIEALYPGAVMADGTNRDDMEDYRPGHKALQELMVKSPLRDAGLTKDEIRTALKELGGEIWNKPAFACLASRIPYGETITAEKLSAVYQAEVGLKALGFDQIRVRHHGDVARIEVRPEDRVRFFDLSFMDQIDKLVRSCGFSFAALDLAGYHMGSLNQLIEKEGETNG